MVDAADYKILSAYHWFARKDGSRTVHFYACREALGRQIFMHHEILGLTKLERGRRVYHANYDGLDNRRENLLYLPDSVGVTHRRKTIVPSASEYKGVYWDREKSRWRAQIGVRGKRIKLGRFREEAAAARAYDEAALEHFGDFAFLNFPVRGRSMSPANTGGIR